MTSDAIHRWVVVQRGSVAHMTSLTRCGYRVVIEGGSKPGGTRREVARRTIARRGMRRHRPICSMAMFTGQRRWRMAETSTLAMATRARSRWRR